MHNRLNAFNESDSLHKLNRQEQVIPFRLKTMHNRFNAFNESDSLHKLNRQEQVIPFRLRTGHNRLNAHMYSKFKVGKSEMS